MTRSAESPPLPPARHAAEPTLRTRRVWFGAALALVIALAIAGVLAAAWTTGTWTTGAPAVAVARVTRQDVSASITTNGQVEPRAPRILVARLDGFVRDVSVTEGSTATAGQMLLTLDATDVRAQLARTRDTQIAAQDQLRTAQAGGNADERAQIERDLQRTEADLVQHTRDRAALTRLVEQHAATPDELAQATLAFQQAESERQFLTRKRAELTQRAEVDAQRARWQAEQARHTIASLETQLASARVAAPVAGTVYRLPVRAGQHVQVGDVLAELADVRQMRVRAFIDEPELGAVAVGQRVTITWDALPGREWHGRIVQRPASVVPRGGRSVGEVLCDVDNDDGTLLPHVNVDVRVRTEVRPRALAVPRAAVRVDGTQRYVFVVTHDRLERRPITVGLASTNDYEVLRGLSEGDRVALPGDAALRDGMAITAIES